MPQIKQDSADKVFKTFPEFTQLTLKSFLNMVGQENVVLRRLDLADHEITQDILQKAQDWTKGGGINNVAQAEQSAFRRAVLHGSFLPFEAIGIFIDNELEAVCLYQLPAHDKRYVLLNFFKYNNHIPKLMDYGSFALGKWFAEQGVVYANLDSDLGMSMLRAFKLALGPVNYFRKYKITPAK